MIGHFPNPYPDELFYSICARFADRMQYPTRYAVFIDLFGTRATALAIDLPGRLGALVAALPPGHYFKEPAQIIDDHTLLPVYGPFLPVERLNRVREGMGQHTKIIASTLTGLGSASVPRLDWLRFCPMCVEEDRRQFDECYWHRVHQVPGVEVCPAHNVPLENSHVGRRPYEFVSAAGALPTVSPRPLAASNPYHEFLLSIARDVAWLLDQGYLAIGPKSLSQRYSILLAECGLASYKGYVNGWALLKAFTTHYSSDLLARLYCEIDEIMRYNWVVRLTHSRDVFHHPLRHLLLIHFLGHTAETFFALPTERKPFGEGPWPCLNPVSDHYRQPQVQECQVTYSGQPIGTFACSCGFVYIRRGPDRSEEDRFRIGRYKAFGPVWEAELNNLWQDPTMSLSQTARRLGVSPEAVTKQAARLNLPFPPPGGRILPNSRIATRPQSPDTNLSTSTVLHEYRTKWLSAIADNPEATRTSLRETLPAVYRWLRRHDKEWLMAHVPPRKTPTRSPPHRANWEERDARLAPKVEIAAQHLKSLTGRPSRVTVSAICREIETPRWIFGYPDKLPLTSQILAEVVETREDFAVRRVQWVAECYRRENARPTRWGLIRRSGIRAKHIWDSPRVKDAIEAALQMLSQQDDA